jgi:hypothetical protein
LGKRDVQAPDMEDHADRDAGVTTREVEEELNVSLMTIWRVSHEQMWQSIVRSAEAYTESHGGHFEHSL